MNKAEPIDVRVRSLVAEYLALDRRHISDEAEFQIPDHLVDEVRGVGDLIRLVEIHATRQGTARGPSAAL
jgi:hypothetical protein